MFLLRLPLVLSVLYEHPWTSVNDRKSYLAGIFFILGALEVG